MRIVLVGPGAIGSRFAGALAEGAAELTVLARLGRRLDQLRRLGLCRFDENGKRHTGWVRVATEIKPDAPKPDILMLCVKSYDTDHALLAAAQAIGPETTVVVLQNGMGGMETAVRRVVPERLAWAGTTAGAGVDDEGWVHENGAGLTMLGAYAGVASPALFELAALLTAQGLPTEIVEDWRRVAFEKLAVNAVINPSTALLGCENGALLAPEFAPLIAAVCDEVAKVARAEGVELKASALMARVIEVAEKTRRNRSSMRADLEAGRPSEIEAINGAVLRLATAHGLATPANAALYALLRNAESDRRGHHSELH